jgi:GNAT superfamily N-acetyltransferase
MRPSATHVRQTSSEDIPGIIALCRRVYAEAPPWTEDQLRSHQAVFPEGQLVAVDQTGAILGFAACLIVNWDDYDAWDTWRDFTDKGYFTNHDAEHGRTLYGAEIMVDPTQQGRGLGSLIYQARRELCQRLGLRRIRAGARLRGYHEHAPEMSAAEYVTRVVRGELRDPTLSFQLGRGFDVLGVVQNYLRHDPESRGWAALIEWRNPDEPQPENCPLRDPRFARPDVGDSPDEAR